MNYYNGRVMVLRIIQKALEPDPTRVAGIHCHCGRRTNGGKPVCSKHVMEMPAAQAARDNYIDPFMGAKPLRDICSTGDRWLLEYHKDYE